MTVKAPASQAKIWGCEVLETVVRVMKVAVVGAGPAGLCCARHLLSYPKHFQFVVLEQMKELGGTWVYTPVSPSEKQPHSSLYKNLRCVCVHNVGFIQSHNLTAKTKSKPVNLVQDIKHWAILCRTRVPHSLSEIHALHALSSWYALHSACHVKALERYS
jgi:monoamine oxidase